MESWESVSNVVEAAQKGLIPAMVEQFERNTIDFLYREYALDNQFKQEVGIGNV